MQYSLLGRYGRIWPMNYYCYLCNEVHEGTPTREHFIPRSMCVPQSQWLPVCEASNGRSNTVFDSDSRDLLYWARHQNTSAVGRSGEALLSDGTLKDFKFSFIETLAPDDTARFDYIRDVGRGEGIPSEKVFAIMFPIGLAPNEKEQYCRGLAKISIGALAYLLKDQNMADEQLRGVFSHSSIDALRNFALNQPVQGGPIGLRFSLGCTDVVSRLQSTCVDQGKRNHVVEVSVKADGSIHIEGMLYSMYGWALDCSSEPMLEQQILRLENIIENMDAPETFKDTTNSPDRICLVNPHYSGVFPEVPSHWKNQSEETVQGKS